MKQVNCASLSFLFYHFFSFFFYQYLFYYTNNTISIAIFYNSKIFINNLINITIIWHIFYFRNRFYKVFKLAIKAIKYIFLKICYIYNFLIFFGRFSFTKITNLDIINWAYLAFFSKIFWPIKTFFLSIK